jgi:hypothetical protein
MDFGLSNDNLLLDDEWLTLILSQPQEPKAFEELLRKAADGATFGVSDHPEMFMPWRRAIATRLHKGQNCWKLTDSQGRAQDELQHGTPMGLSCDESVTEKA